MMKHFSEHLYAAKELGALVMVHAENGDVIDYLTKKAVDRRKHRSNLSCFN